MDKDEALSDSEASDEDYVPNGAENELLSEEESDEVEEEDNSHDVEKGKKRKNKTRRKSKKIKVSEEPEECEKVEAKSMTEEERREHEKKLWASFLGNDTKSSTETTSKATSNGSALSKDIKKPPVEDKTVTKIFEFAGEEVRMDDKETSSASTSSNSDVSTSKPVLPRGRGRSGLGLSAVLGQIGKKTKLSVLEKSKMDWDKFKNKEGLTEDIQNHNKGKDGYLEKQDFLQRTDLRQFEIEKQLRSNRRSNR